MIFKDKTLKKPACSSNKLRYSSLLLMSITLAFAVAQVSLYFKTWITFTTLFV